MNAWKTIRVFISSTFRDMQAERDWLVRFTFPKLRVELLKWRIHLEDVDLRWGVTSDQDAFDLCMKEIDLCRPRFICMLGWRYGWVPPPKQIAAGDFVKVLDGASPAGALTPTEKESLTSIYSPAEVNGNFHLKPKPKTTDALKQYQEHCEAAVSALQRAEQVEAKLSITASEIHHGALERLSTPAFRSFYIRKGNPTDKIPATYIEKPGTLAVAYLDDLKAQLKNPATKGKVVVSPGHEEFRPLTCHEYPWDWDDQTERISQLEAFGEFVRADIIASVIAEFGDNPEHKPAVTDEELFAEEDEAMESFIQERTRKGRYVESSRDKLLEEMEIFAKADSAPNILVLTGAPGSGKSAFLAKFVREFEKHHSSLLIRHFVGVSAGSTDLRRTLRRLCHKLAPLADNREPLPQDIKELIPQFQKLLTDAAKKQRIILVLDALNQFDETDSAHYLHWLPSTLPSNVRIIASVITPPEGQPEHNTLRNLRERKARIETLEPLNDQDSRAILTDFLHRYSKNLTDAQIAAILRKPESNLPLYLLVILEELRTLGTDEQLTALSISKIPPDELKRLREEDHDEILKIFIEKELPDTALELFEWILIKRLPQDQFLSKDPKEAAALVEKFAACLAASRHGLSEPELAAILAPDPNGNHDKQGNVAALLRLLRPYLMRRGELLDFYHGQFREAAVAAHLDTPEKQRAAHQSVATCLQAFADPHRDGQCRDATPHALSELPHHQTRAEAWPDLIATLENIFFLEAKVTHGMTFDLVVDFTTAVEALPPEHAERQRLRLLNEALRRDIHFIARHAQDYPQAFFQSLWNSCWWFDCIEAAQHYNDGQGSRNTLGQKLSSLLERWRSEREASHPRFSWLQSLRPPSVHLGTAQLAVLKGHEREVSSVAFSSGGRRILSGSADGCVRLWDAQSGAALAVLKGHEREVSSVAFSPDERRILSGSGDWTVRLWDAQSGAALAVLQGHEHEVTSVVFSPDGQRILSGSNDKTVRLWDAQSGAALVVLKGHEDVVSSVAFSPDGRRILSGSNDKTVRLWDAQSGAALAVLQGHEHEVTSVAFSPDGRRILSGSWDRTVRLWDAKSGAALAVLHGHELWVTSVAFSPDGRRIISGSWDDTVRLWDAQSGAALAVLKGHEKLVISVAFSPDGRHILSGSWDRTVRLWDAQSGAALAVLQGHEHQVTSLAFSPDGRRILSGSNDKTVRLWDAQSGAALAVLQGHNHYVIRVAFSPDGRRIVSRSKDETVRLWDAQSGATLAVLQGHRAFSPDGRRSLGVSADNTVRLWDAQSGAELAAFNGHGDTVTSVGFSPDGRCILIGSWDTVRLWDAQSHQCLEEIPVRGDITALAAGASAVPWRATERNDETVVQPSAGGPPVAWFPDALALITTHPEGRLWAGAVFQSRHLVLLRLDGD